METLTPIEGSSQIAAIGHEGETLAVQFHSGAVYHYEGVNEETYQSFLSADSAGKFFGQTIRGKFDYAKQEPEEE